MCKSDGALFILHELGAGWRPVAALKFVPRVVRDWCYDLIANNRYYIFGRYDQCLLPDEKYKGKFIEV